MKAELKSLSSPDIPDLSTYIPDDENNFGFALDLYVGTANENSSERFSATVCTPNWLNSTHTSGTIMWGRHLIIVDRYDYEALVARIKNYLQTCDGENWHEVALKVGRIAQWEFEDYKD